MPDAQSMIERLARIAADQIYVYRIPDCERPDEPPLSSPVGWENLSQIDRTAAIKAVRAVITAMREPTTKMRYSLTQEMFDEGYSTPIWQAMIDAALEDGR